MSTLENGEAMLSAAQNSMTRMVGSCVSRVAVSSLKVINDWTLSRVASRTGPYEMGVYRGAVDD